ncbi:MFS transporter [Sphingomonas psychrotolerans]|uniref:MFS transporter n=1 Tax=Sphingomonas psychrotolerans TaxID=1327635 RepID=A0A2K8MKH2_9SPHN|nr:MFS transporter [Sphingomonas psychrotolerans]ATY32249.1 MFS transporter [Sphingomonas psychrotolerans]
MDARRETRSPFDLPLFRAIWVASLFSNFGGLIQSVGASWMMTSLSGSPQMIALVQASISLPIMLLSLWAGAVADNLDRRKVMLAAQFFMLIVSALLALGGWAGVLTPWLLLGFTFLIGCGTAINGPAWQASVGDMVPRAMLPGAVAFNSMGFNLARSLGPAIGGAIVAAAGAAAAFLVNAVSYVGLIVVLARWKPDLPPARLPRERIGLAMIAGIRYARLSPPIRTVLVRAALFGFAASAVPALMPLVARDIVGGGPLTYGLLLGSFGLGAVAGALGSQRLRRRLSTEGLVRLAAPVLALGAATTAVSGWLALTLLALALCGAGWVVALSTFNVSVQMASPRWVVARALALYQMAAFGGMAGGSWVFGMIASARSVEAALLAAAAFQILSVAAGFVWRLPAISQLNLDPRDSWREPQTAVPVEPRSGPIVITIEHRIAEANISAFLAVMSERRRIRRRDGAQHWALLRDLGDTELWIERYHVATWLDYVRHNHRRTHADDANSEALRRLRIGDGEPVVHRRIERQTGSLPASRAPDPRELGGVTDPSGSS